LCATECDVSPIDFLGKFYTDSLVHSQRSLDLLVDVIGEDKIILGTDYPFPLGELEAGSLIENSMLSKSIKVKFKVVYGF
jgi:aminocarboxymuconate-semialdehyde decarboxylase